MNIKPILDRVLIEPIKKEKETKSGIILSSSSSERPELGIVVAFGSGKTTENEKIDFELKLKDKVLFNKYAGTEVSLDGKDYLILKYCDILAVIE